MKSLLKYATTATFIFVCNVVLAQNAGIQKGTQAITQATTDLKGFFAPVTSLLYVIAAILGLFGGFKVYSKWQNGDQDVMKGAVGWVGSALFLLSVAAVLQAFFF